MIYEVARFPFLAKFYSLKSKPFSIKITIDISTNTFRVGLPVLASSTNRSSDGNDTMIYTRSKKL